MNSGIYIIKNSINNKVYVGSAIGVENRLKEHKNELQKRTHRNIKLQRAWNKYGKDAFEFIKIKTCKLEELLWYEQEALNHFDSVKNGYNICSIAGNTLGVRCSEETKAKLREANKGKIISKKQKRKIIKANRNRWKNPEFRVKMTVKMKEIAAARDQIKLRAPKTEEIKKRMSEGAKLVDRSYVSESNSKRWNNPKFREEQSVKMSIRSKKIWEKKSQQKQIGNDFANL